MKELKAGPVLVEPDYLSQATMHAGSLRCITQCEGTYAVGIERVKRRKDLILPGNGIPPKYMSLR